MMHNKASHKLNFNNIVLTSGIIVLFFFSILSLTNESSIRAFSQIPSLEQGLNVSHQQVPVGNFTISGTSSYDRSTACKVYVGWKGFILGGVKDQFTINKPAANLTTFSPKEDVAFTNEVDSRMSSWIHRLSEPAHGSIILNANKTITYLPKRDYFGTDSFNYTLSSRNSNFI